MSGLRYRPPVTPLSPRPPAPAVILFDWDNTLVDAWAGVVAALNVVFDRFGLPAWTVEEGRQRIRGSMRDSFPPLFGADWETAIAAFGPAMRAVHLSHVNVLPGTEAMLDAAAAAVPIGVVSNKNSEFLRREIAHLGWQDRFRAVVGAGDASADKPHAAPIWHALAMIGVQAGAPVWYVGDTALDMQTAHAAGCTAVLLGDAAHDGGLALMQERGAWPGLVFSDAQALAAHLRTLEPEVASPA